MRDIRKATRTRRSARLVLIATLMYACFAPSLGVAQEASAPTPEERRQAADAFDRGTSAMLSRDYAAAAHWFEQANRLAPSPVALMQAMRANERTGNPLRVANLALRLRDLYPNDAQGQATAAEAIGHASSHYVEVRVTCSAPCAVDAEGTLQDHRSFYIAPDRNTTIHASFPGGTLSDTVTGPAGSIRTLSFEAPPPPPEPEPGAEPMANGATSDTHRARRVPRAVFWSGVGVTAALGGVAVWSLIDRNQGVSAYNLMPTEAGYNAGHQKEIRTDILAACTAGAGLTTMMLAFFTNWRGHHDRASSSTSTQRLEPSVGLSPSGGVLNLRGRF